ncbi:rhodanese-like domain-containing protein [Tautonia rosea]|uniref:rhodanese-like domain-containing protein n=1 Tax=Tautonia rosea TaxID=2728037 RepID=UPI0014756E63|nr:rhodanese-like domain-containing protein [Tautonia rosea]
MSIATISPKELEERRKQGRPVDLVDVRTPVEFREFHAEPARLVPLDQLEPKSVMDARNGSRDEPLYLICRTGNRAHKAAEKFLSAGFENVVNVEGGTQAWEAAGLPVVRGKKAISLERQVRIAAGTMVAIGTVLGAFVNPWFLVIPGFVGAGLVFAGITDTCGMGMMLAKMPWNRVGCDTSCAR